MLAFTSCFLLATTALAAPRTGAPWGGQYFPDPGSIYPIDYNDDLHINNPLIKSGNLIYSFEQTRRDQPPQVEVREENLGRYMYRKPKPTTTTTTTTTTTPLPETTTEIEEVRLELHDIYEPRVPEVRIWPSIPSVRKPTSPLPSNFDDFSIDLPDSSRINPEARYPPINIWTPRVISTPPPAPLPNWEDEYRPQQRVSTTRNWKPSSVQEEYVSEPTRQWSQDYGRNYQPQNVQSRVVEDSAYPQWAELKVPEPPVHDSRSIANRGNHKFNWDDLLPSTTTLAPVQKITAAPLIRRPPVPTLTPWAGDNFGK